MSNVLDLSALNNLSPSEKEYALKILKEIAQNGYSKEYDNLKYAEYSEIPVDIETFLTNDTYLGQAWKDAGGNLKLYDFWMERLKELFPTNIDTAYNTLLESGARGIGKATSLDTLVLTNEGFIKMGDITYNHKVYGEDGNLHNIIGIYPQGKIDVYKFTFSDGSSIKCCENHLWQVTNHHVCRQHKYQGPETSILSTKELLKYSLTPGQNRFSIPMSSPVHFPKRDCFISPYMLGCLLGDGCFTRNNITFVSNDIDILNYFNNELSNNGYVFQPYNINKKYSKTSAINGSIKINYQDTLNKYVRTVKELGLMGTNSETKFIPKEYLYNDIESRIALLQGLMDTDGTASRAKMRNGKGYSTCATFSTVSPQLKDDIIWLVQSLGGVARCKLKDRKTYHYVNKDKGIDEYRPCKPHYRITIKLPTYIEPFRLKRKLDIYHLQNHTEPSRYITSIEKLSEQEECQCIRIDNPTHLFLIENFIVTHNSEIACGCVGAYLMYRVMCMKNPLEFFHLKQTEKICFAFMNIKLDLAEEIAISKFQKTIQMSPWFMSKGRMTSFHGNPYWVPPDPIKIIIGSQSDDVIGQPIFFAFFDEISFIKNQDIDKQKKKAKDMIDTAIGGMFTRFIYNGKNPTMLVVASSKRSEQSFMEEYIKVLSKTEGNSTLVIDKPVWEVKPKGTYSDKTFYIGLGNKFLESIVIPENDRNNLNIYRDRGYKILEVPIDFRSKFLEDIDRNLCDFAGVSSNASNKYMSGQVVSDNINDKFENPFPDILEIGNAKTDTAQYYNFFNLEKVPKQYMDKPLFIHLDMSKSGDMTGIAGTWIVGKKPSNDQDQSKDLMLQLAFSTSIKAPKGQQISYEKNRKFIRWLKEIGFKIKGISTDSYQSVDTAQQLVAEGYNYTMISVDRVDSDGICKPYQYLRSCVYEQRLLMYRSVRLFDEFVDIERNNNSGKIDHTPNGHKDVLDAVCGSVWNASKHAEEYAYDYGESLDETVSVNKQEGTLNMQQIAIDFEQEMIKILNPVQANIIETTSNNCINNIDSHSSDKKKSDIGVALPTSYTMGDIIIW